MSQQRLRFQIRLRHLLVIPVFGVAIWWLYTVLDPAISRSARTHLASLLDNRPDDLYQFAGEEERKTGLTAETFQRFWNEFAWPRLEKCESLGGVVSEVGKDRSWAIAEVDVVTPEGHTHPLGVTMHGSQNGAKMNLVNAILTAIWLLEATDSQAPRSTSLERISWRRTCLERDRANLESVGIRGWWTYEWGYLGWDKVLARYRGMEDSLRKEAAAEAARAATDPPRRGVASGQ